MSERATISTNKSRDAIVCYSPTMITTNGIWQGEDPLDFALPLFVLQVTLIICTTRILVFILKPFRQPRVIAEILGGVILGPSVLGRSTEFSITLFPLRSVMVLETMANVGLLYFLFLVGVEMDIVQVIKSSGRKAVIIAVTGMILPFLIGVSFSFILHQSAQYVKLGIFIIFLGVALSVTAFPVLARILAELKLVNTEIGKIAMASALLNDMCAWVLLAVALAVAENEYWSLNSLMVIAGTAAFVVFCIYVVRPLILWIIQKTPEGESVSEFYICLILSGVMISGFITDAIGTHSVFGAFVYGLVIPNGPIGVTLIERLEDFVLGLLLPLFFAISGLKTDVTSIKGAGTWATLALVIVLASAGKITGTLLVSLYYDIPFYEGLTLGLLMNTKGLVEIIVLNVGKDQNVLDDKTFAIMVIVAVVMTSIVQPGVTTLYRPARKRVAYKRRTIQRTKPDGEFRVVVCVHTPRNVPTIIQLLEASHPTKKSPISTYVLHLVELSGRASAVHIVQYTRKSGRPAINRMQAQSDHIFNAFQNFEQHGGFVSVTPFTAISQYSTIHEDICNLAEDKRAALIIIPFHKHQTVDGRMEDTNSSFRMLNQNVLAHAPCSVGILVDRGLNGQKRLSQNQILHHIAVLFFGGPDDREALAYAWRLSQHPGNNITVMRFVLGDNGLETTTESNSGQETLTVETDDDREKKLDEKCIHEFREITMHSSAVMYMEKVVNHGEETVAAIRTIDGNHDLFIVGKGRAVISPFTAGLSDWSECPELGAIGDLLASSDFLATYSVLVLQQYVGMETIGDTTICMPDSPTQQQGRPDSGQRRSPPQDTAIF
ncbi:cation/H(+) antiporter 15 [Sesamum indicum]|uniref:Cation/H(+) antiporter 15 n=1 Tax=Sesamum indicum TaxID=4182 RepID=A0A6I9SKC5_SESIN|nr:cation/H(+) antiporter 15 [Sesamum indicum]